MKPIRAASALLVGLAVFAWQPALASAQHGPPGELAGAEREAGEILQQDAEQAIADGGRAAHGEVNKNPLEFKTDLAIWTGVIFLVLFVVLWKFAWGPILAGLDKRERGIADQISSAERTNQDARDLLARYEEKLAQSEDEVRRMLDDAKRDAQKVGQQIVDTSRQEAEAEHRRALGEIELATSGALKELAEHSATLAVELAGKIVAGRLDPAAHAKLIQDAVSRFPSTEPGKN
jgi:F-type H+-transporting ATPase subunit b